MATITRARDGTSVNVVSAVRCENSPVTSSTPISGSRIAVGITALPNTCVNVWLMSGPVRTVISTGPIATTATQIGSQKPDRVSNILRSSTVVSRARLGRRSSRTRVRVTCVRRLIRYRAHRETSWLGIVRRRSL